jgi:hypothetical protein
MKLKPSEKKDFNEYQIAYVEKMHRRLFQIYLSLNKSNDPEVKFLWYKELLAIFSEVAKIKSFSDKIRGFAPYMRDMVYLVQFIRNLLFHFPYFSKWDDVSITYNQAFAQQENDPESKNPDREMPIARFLNPKNSRTSFFLKIKYLNVEAWIEDKVNFPKPESPDEEVYLKNIIKEEKGLRCIIAAMELVFHFFLIRKDISAYNISLNNSSRQIDNLIKKYLEASGIPAEHRLGYNPFITTAMFDKYNTEPFTINQPPVFSPMLHFEFAVK